MNRFDGFPGACDCHFHIMDSSFPTMANASVRNLTASVDDYNIFARQIGTSRGVIVQPSLYGTNNECTLTAVETLGPEFRAVVVADDQVTTRTLAQWHARGARGVRFNQIQAGATTMAMMPDIARQIAEFGWHIQLHIQAERLTDYAQMLESLPVAVVLDHCARPNVQDGEPVGLDHILRWFETGRLWIKLSGPYHVDPAGAPYSAALALAARFVAANPERLLWGSDWPHVTEKRRPVPRPLVDFLFDAAPGDTLRRGLLVDNPALLYGFDARA